MGMKTPLVMAFVVSLLGAADLSAQGTGGMMGQGGYGGMMGGGMMGSWDYIPPGVRTALTIDQAVDQVRNYLADWGNPDLAVSEVMQFSNHFYAEVAEKSTKRKAFELLLNKYTGAVFAEPGPTMIWNLKYGQMTGGMMGGLAQQAQTDTMPISGAKALELGQSYLDAQNRGLKVEIGFDEFYGYYTIHVLKGGKTYGMLGVNGYTGQVWMHTWHGQFVDMKEIDITK
jgi:hypothetical protein